MDKETSTTLLKLIHTKLLTKEDCTIAFDLIKDRFKQLNAMIANAFHVGEEVSFTSRRTDTKIHGTVLKINRQTVTVKTEGYGVWNVSPSALAKVVPEPTAK
jgi:hypothetical protein